MAYDKNNIGKPARDRVNLSELYEVQDWSKKFSVNKEDIRRAIKEVWNNIKDFEQFLQKKKS